MLFVLAAWACMALAMFLSWLWLVHHGPHGAVAQSGDCARDTAARANTTRLTRVTLRSVAMLAALSAALLLLHFLLPDQEARADREWAAPHLRARNATASANASASAASNHTRVSERAPAFVPRRRGRI